MNDITMTEAFDGEFLDMGGESFFDIVDQDGPSHDAGYVYHSPSFRYHDLQSIA